MTLFTSLPAEGSAAIISSCRRYRYLLERRVGPQSKICLFIMLNPSTADAHLDDPTIRRCKGFAKSFQCGTLSVVNLFAYRATKPADMLAAEDPIGPENNRWIARAAEDAKVSGGLVIAAWGAHGMHKDRDKQVLALLDSWDVQPMSLAETASGMPRHPLYVRGDCKPLPYGPARG
jgi:hypothetical protein